MKQIDDLTKSHLINLFHMALSDHQIDTKELELLYEIGLRLGVSQLDIEQSILKSDQVVFTAPSSLEKKIEYLFDFAKMIWADQKVEENEIDALCKFCVKFGFEKTNAEAISKFLIEEARKGTEISDLITTVNQNL